MLPRFLLILLFTGLCACGQKNVAAERSGTALARNAAAPARLSLASEAFIDGQLIPSSYTCDGANQPPPLHWTDVPTGTRSFALVVEDPDAPGGIFRHWGVYDIPGSARAIDAGHPLGREAQNDFGKPGYGGPCPPKGGGRHHYHVRIFALEVDHLPLPAGAKISELEQAAEQKALGEGEIIGTYERH
jgi:Raf kinase inhibitor-like YbhB/YbcL family protein